MLRLLLFLCGLLLVTSTKVKYEEDLMDCHQDSEESDEDGSDSNEDEDDDDDSNQSEDVSENDDSFYCDNETTTPLPKDDCSPSNNNALHKLFRKLTPVLPRERLQNIIANAASCDKEVCNLRKLMSSKDFRQKVEKLKATKEQRVLSDFVCKQRLHYETYLNFIRIFMNIRTKKKASRPIKNARPGLSGLFNDLTDALPKCEIEKIHDDLGKTDDGLAKVESLICSNEYRKVLWNYRNSPEYLDIRNTLEDAGMPMWSVIRLVNTVLGWKDLDSGAERTIWEV